MWWRGQWRDWRPTPLRFLAPAPPPLGRPIAVAPFGAANLAVERLLPDALLELTVSLHEFLAHVLLPDER